MKRVLTFAAMLLASALLVVWAGVAPLDGKTFQGEIKDKGKAHGDKDTFVFADGRFHSTACDAYGYDAATYTAMRATCGRSRRRPTVRNGAR
jgi:hypothetical protein